MERKLSSTTSFQRVLRRKSGFTLIEILMVLVLIAILTAVAITAFTNFTKESKDRTVKSNLKIMRDAIATQQGQVILRCGGTGLSWPPIANLSANDITNAGTPCLTSQVGVAPGVISDRLFVADGIPINSWGIGLTAVNSTETLANAADRLITQCAGTGCRSGVGFLTMPVKDCAGTGTWAVEASTTLENGWCYDVSSGLIWANTAANDNVGSSAVSPITRDGLGNEYTY